MITLADRLRGVVLGAVAPAGGKPAAPARPPDTSVTETLEGEWQECGDGRFIVVERTYRPGHRHGRLALMDHVLPPDSLWRDVLVRSDRAGASVPPAGTGRHRTLFVDLETTGLAGGAGTCAFLVGCGWFEGCSFRIRQMLLTDYASERRLLDAVRALADITSLVVSFNGKSFDLPLIETRFLFNRMETPFAGLPHLDMLHAARRLWDPAGDVEDLDGEGRAGCERGYRLTALEQAICGFERQGDVGGFEIPSRYFHFVRTGDPRPLVAVLEHNRLDILALAFLTARAAQLVDGGPDAAGTSREAFGLGGLYERAGRSEQAGRCFARAAGLGEGARLPGDEATRRQALRAFARHARRQRRHQDAASAWQCLLDSGDLSPRLAGEAAEALAVHHEHRLRDLQTARALALGALPFQATPARAQAVRHRLARLDRKLQQRAYMPARLFEDAAQPRR